MNKKLLIAALICLVLCILFVFLYFRFAPAKKAAEPEPFPVNPAAAPESPPVAEPPPLTPAASPLPAETETESDPAEPYVSPVDFQVLQAENPDIYAWLTIEGTEITYPLLQSEDDTFYLDHNRRGEYDANGALYTESAYNGRTFDDKITVIYGHRMKSGAMFGTLQTTFSTPESLDEHGDITVYTPERELHYKVFAAVPYSNTHIMFTYGNGTARGLKAFLSSVSSVHSLDAYISSEDFAGSGDNVIVLSTCLYGNRSRRFLVIAKLV